MKTINDLYESLLKAGKPKAQLSLHRDSLSTTGNDHSILNYKLPTPLGNLEYEVTTTSINGDTKIHSETIEISTFTSKPLPEFMICSSEREYHNWRMSQSTDTEFENEYHTALISSSEIWDNPSQLYYIDRALDKASELINIDEHLSKLPEGFSIHTDPMTDDEPEYLLLSTETLLIAQPTSLRYTLETGPWYKGALQYKNVGIFNSYADTSELLEQYYDLGQYLAESLEKLVDMKFRKVIVHQS